MYVIRTVSVHFFHAKLLITKGQRLPAATQPLALAGFGFSQGEDEGGGLL